jgi:hypothetical protein
VRPPCNFTQRSLQILIKPVYSEIQTGDRVPTQDRSKSATSQICPQVGLYRYCLRIIASPGCIVTHEIARFSFLSSSNDSRLWRWRRSSPQSRPARARTDHLCYPVPARCIRRTVAITVYQEEQKRVVRVSVGDDGHDDHEHVRYRSCAINLLP